jgi:hypothetical protein
MLGKNCFWLCKNIETWKYDVFPTVLDDSVSPSVLQQQVVLEVLRLSGAVQLDKLGVVFAAHRPPAVVFWSSDWLHAMPFLS